MLRRRRTDWWLWAALLGAGLAWSGCSMVEGYKTRKAVGEDPEIAQLEQSRAELLAALPDLSAHFGADDPSVQAVQHQIDQIDKMIELRRQMLRRQMQADRRVRRSMPRL